MQLTPAEHVQLEAIKMQREVCAGGHCTFILGGKALPTLSVK